MNGFGCSLSTSASNLQSADGVVGPHPVHPLSCTFSLCFFRGRPSVKRLILLTPALGLIPERAPIREHLRTNR